MRKFIMLLLVISTIAVFVIGIITCILFYKGGNKVDYEVELFGEIEKYTYTSKGSPLYGTLFILITYMATILSILYTSLVGSSLDRRNKVAQGSISIAIGGFLAIVFLVILIVTSANASKVLTHAPKHVWEMYSPQLITWATLSLIQNIIFVVAGVFMFFVNYEIKSIDGSESFMEKISEQQ